MARFTYDEKLHESVVASLNGKAEEIDKLIDKYKLSALHFKYTRISEGDFALDAVAMVNERLGFDFGGPASAKAESFLAEVKQVTGLELDIGFSRDRDVREVG